MTGWRSSAGSGPLTWMLSNATSTAWAKIKQHQRKRRQGEDGRRAIRACPGWKGLPIAVATGDTQDDHGAGRLYFDLGRSVHVRHPAYSPRSPAGGTQL